LAPNSGFLGAFRIVSRKGAESIETLKANLDDAMLEGY
jgi:hypothetical protein